MMVVETAMTMIKAIITVVAATATTLVVVEKEVGKRKRGDDGGGSSNKRRVSWRRGNARSMVATRGTDAMGTHTPRMKKLIRNAAKGSWAVMILQNFPGLSRITKAPSAITRGRHQK